jgi:hypothetical protein
MTIYIILKLWSGGKVEVLSAFKTEEEARQRACQYLPLGIKDYSISIWTTELQ